MLSANDVSVIWNQTNVFMLMFSVNCYGEAATCCVHKEELNTVFPSDGSNLCLESSSRGQL